MSNSSVYFPFVPWELREEDIAVGAVEFFDYYTCYVGDSDAPPCIKNLHGMKVTLCKTNANGKCGLHAVLGVPNSRATLMASSNELTIVECPLCNVALKSDSCQPFVRRSSSEAFAALC